MTYTRWRNVDVPGDSTNFIDKILEFFAEFVDGSS
jgi:hypothetical protein